jgi:hypothetical protein
MDPDRYRQTGADWWIDSHKRIYASYDAAVARVRKLEAASNRCECAGCDTHAGRCEHLNGAHIGALTISLKIAALMRNWNAARQDNFVLYCQVCPQHHSACGRAALFDIAEVMGGAAG